MRRLSGVALHTSVASSEWLTACHSEGALATEESSVRTADPDTRSPSRCSGSLLRDDIPRYSLLAALMFRQLVPRRRLLLFGERRDALVPVPNHGHEFARDVGVELDARSLGNVGERALRFPRLPVRTLGA